MGNLWNLRTVRTTVCRHANATGSMGWLLSRQNSRRSIGVRCIWPHSLSAQKAPEQGDLAPPAASCLAPARIGLGQDDMSRILARRLVLAKATACAAAFSEARRCASAKASRKRKPAPRAVAPRRQLRTAVEQVHQHIELRLAAPEVDALDVRIEHGEGVEQAAQHVHLLDQKLYSLPSTPNWSAPEPRRRARCRTGAAYRAVQPVIPGHHEPIGVGDVGVGRLAMARMVARASCRRSVRRRPEAVIDRQSVSATLTIWPLPR